MVSIPAWAGCAAAHHRPHRPHPDGASIPAWAGCAAARRNPQPRGPEMGFYPSVGWVCCSTHPAVCFLTARKRVSIPAWAGCAAAQGSMADVLREAFLSQRGLGVLQHELLGSKVSFERFYPSVGWVCCSTGVYSSHASTVSFYPSVGWVCCSTGADFGDFSDRRHHHVFLSQRGLGVLQHVWENMLKQLGRVSIPAWAGCAAARSDDGKRTRIGVSIPAWAGCAAALRAHGGKMWWRSFYPSVGWVCCSTWKACSRPCSAVFLSQRGLGVLQH